MRGLYAFTEEFSRMLKEDKIKEIYDVLLDMFPNARCELNYNNAYELLVAVMLSAQTTDKAVNLITPTLFSHYPTIESLSLAKLEEVENDIKRIGLYHNKAQNIINMAKKVLNEYGGEIPSDLEKLKALPGVGQKTANVVLTEWFKIPRIPVDTHVERVSKRLGLASSEHSVLQVENILMALMPESKYHMTHHLLLFFGRYHCLSRNPKCDNCRLKKYCVYDKKPLN